MFKMFVTVDKRKASNLLSVKQLLSGLNIRPATLKMRLLVISKLLTVFSNWAAIFSVVCNGLTRGLSQGGGT